MILKEKFSAIYYTHTNDLQDIGKVEADDFVDYRSFIHSEKLECKFYKKYLYKTKKGAYNSLIRLIDKEIESEFASIMRWKSRRKNILKLLEENKND